MYRKGLVMFYEHKNEIAFRKLEVGDLVELKSLKDESWFGTVNTACVNMKDQVSWFESISKDKSCLYLIANSLSSAPVSPIGLYGITDINPINRSCSFTHSLYKKFRGKGLGKLTLQAGIDLTFELLNMRRIETWILDNNKAELKTASSVGFQVEGAKRQAVYKCGQYLDCHLLGLLRSEWEATERVKSYNGCCNASYKPKDA
jgi:RimJ/RimL family protein N-acetyltransferase